ncbi:MAG: dihydroneopterin aldolase family protein [Methanomassiliicoccus sp.]|nr:dihydroneopterin aldolase family protein [Methanomassiliicoccus sp.]
MRASREERAASYFRCTDRERATFEAGVKLATVYHQFIGTPVSTSNAESLERAIEEGVKVQPFVESVEVRIRRDRLKMKKNEYDYQSLTGEMLDVKVTIHIGDVRTVGEMRYLEDIRYPLMFISSIEESARP